MIFKTDLTKLRTAIFTIPFKFLVTLYQYLRILSLFLQTPNPFLNAAEFVASGVANDESHGLIIYVIEYYLTFVFTSVKANDAAVEKDQKMLV